MAKTTTKGKPVKAEELTSDRIPMKTAANPSQQTAKTASIPTNFAARLAEKDAAQKAAQKEKQMKDDAQMARMGLTV